LILDEWVFRKDFKELLHNKNMKKEIIALLIILLFPLIMAQEVTDTTGPNVNNPSIDFNQNLENINNFFSDTQIEIPESLQGFSQVLFGIKEPISLQLLIILAGIWLLSFMFVYQGIALMPIFESVDFEIFNLNPSAIIVAAIITSIASVSGIIKKAAEVFLTLATNIKIIGEYAIITTIIAVLITILIIYGISKLFSVLKKEKELAEAEDEGLDIAKLSLKAKIANKDFMKGAGI